MEGKLHVYHPKRSLTLWEYSPAGSTPSSPQQNILLFVGGMYDNYLYPGYVSDLAALFHITPTWRVCHVQLSSAGRSFGICDLDRDVDEISASVNYIRSTPSLGDQHTKIVLMGNSTGCQDVLHYVHSSPKPLPSNANDVPRPSIQGAILQAPVSDRDHLLHSLATNPTAKSNYDECMKMISHTPSEQHRTTILPMHWTTTLFGPAPMSIARFLSLASPYSPAKPGPDDLFSDDGTESRLNETFGRVGRQDSPLQPAKSGKREMLILISASDEAVPQHVDKEAMMKRWDKAITGGGGAMSKWSQIVKDGNHALQGEELPQRRARLVEMRKSVLGYLQDVVGAPDPEAWEVWGRDEATIEREEKEQGGTGGGVERGMKEMKI